MSFEIAVDVLAKTLYIVKTRRVSVRRAFTLACKTSVCRSQEFTREDLYMLARGFISNYYKLLYIAEAAGKRNPSGRLMARLYLYLYLREHGLKPPSKLRKLVVRDIGDLDKQVVGLEKWSLLSYPRWLYEKLSSLLTPLEVEKLLEAMNKRTLWVRINTLKVDLDRAIRMLEEESVVLEVDKDLPFMVKIKQSNKPIRTLKMFHEGLIIPQDKASALVVTALNPTQDSTIYDFAAAPGVKASLIMQLTENKARVVAIDISPRRLEAMKKLLRLYGVDTSRVTLMLGDGGAVELRDKSEFALVDAPCSSSGAISKDPAIKIFLETPDPVYKFKEVQERILINALKHSDTVVYATCSLLPEEGEEVVLSALTSGADHRVVEPGINASRGYMKYQYWDKFRRTFPHIHMSEGFFISRLEK